MIRSGLLVHWCRKVKGSVGFVSDCKALAGVVMLFTQGAVLRHLRFHKTFKLRGLWEVMLA